VTIIIRRKTQTSGNRLRIPARTDLLEPTVQI